jgi:hypothetical protein
MITKQLKIAFVTAALALGGLAGFAGAKGFHGPDNKGFKQRFDVNKDGQLDDAERAKLKEAFAAKRAQHKATALAKFDGNRDGQLDDAERTAMRDARILQRFAKLDSNGDGQLSVDEFKSARMGKGKGMRKGMRGHHRGMRKQP